MAAGINNQTQNPLQTLFGTHGYQGIPVDIHKRVLLCCRIGSQYCTGFDFQTDPIDTLVGKTPGTVGNLVGIGSGIDIQD